MVRRHFLIMGLVGACGCLGCGVNAASSGTRGGCVFTARSPSDARSNTQFRLPEFSRSTGNRATDENLARYVIDASRLFGVHPDVVVYDDSKNPNSMFSSTPIRENAYGTVLLGKTHISRYLRDRYGAAAMRGLIAHEMAHAYQWNHGFIDRLRSVSRTDIAIELHADGLAGWCLGSLTHSVDKETLYYGVARVWDTLGSTNLDASDSHGTAMQRRRAIESGYILATREMKDVQTTATIIFDRISDFL